MAKTGACGLQGLGGGATGSTLLTVREPAGWGADWWAQRVCWEQLVRTVKRTGSRIPRRELVTQLTGGGAGRESLGHAAAGDGAPGGREALSGEAARPPNTRWAPTTQEGRGLGLKAEVGL